mmetsp:Transcript_132540/g.314197  ORF Transcript_132540/g.314197 Transcript_132540/m.314197 type:complete len:245 (-) Transcript_132540:644-1378(-)
MDEVQAEWCGERHRVACVGRNCCRPVLRKNVTLPEVLQVVQTVCNRDHDVRSILAQLCKVWERIFCQCFFVLVLAAKTVKRACNPSEGVVPLHCVLELPKLALTQTGHGVKTQIQKPLHISQGRLIVCSPLLHAEAFAGMYQHEARRVVLRPIRFETDRWTDIPHTRVHLSIPHASMTVDMQLALECPRLLVNHVTPYSLHRVFPGLVKRQALSREEVGERNHGLVALEAKEGFVQLHHILPDL